MALLQPVFPEPEEAGAAVLSVTALSQQLKRQIELQFSRVRVRGEISGCKRHYSGHTYFSLKDQNGEAVLNAICWRGTHTSVALQDGLEIIATGRVSTYPGRSNYQIIVQEAEAAGEGALLKLLQERKKQLAAEGLFDNHRPLPPYPERIGVITSPTGAVLQDILHRLADRYPCPVLLYPVAVQGEGAAEQVARAIAYMDALPPGRRPDVLIVARGGGSIEDLWAFNEEVVVRAAHASTIPLISAVGHETDTTLIDYAADMRAPTPTAAAELAVPVLQQICQDLHTLQHRSVQALYKAVDRMELRLRALRLPSIQQWLNERGMRCDDNCERLSLAMQQMLQRKGDALGYARLLLKPPRARLDHAQDLLARTWRQADRAAAACLKQATDRVSTLSTRLEHSSYASILQRGFCVVSTENGSAVLTTCAAARQAAGPVALHFQDGSLPARILPTQ